MARQRARRQQRERITGIAVVCLGVVVLAIAVIALREPNGHVSSAAAQGKSASSVAKQTTTHPRHKTSRPASHPSGHASAGADDQSATAVKNVPLVVLNNSTISHLAEQAATQFENGGWTVRTYGNYQNDILSTCAYYDEADPAAKSAAEALQTQYPTIKRVKPKFPELPSGPVVVVLTSDYSAG
jgi:hypothetical protein